MFLMHSRPRVMKSSSSPSPSSLSVNCMNQRTVLARINTAAQVPHTLPMQLFQNSRGHIRKCGTETLIPRANQSVQNVPQYRLELNKTSQ